MGCYKQSDNRHDKTKRSFSLTLKDAASIEHGEGESEGVLDELLEPVGLASAVVVENLVEVVLAKCQRWYQACSIISA